MKSIYNIPVEVIKDIDLYKLEVERFLNGEVSKDSLKPFRVARGIYGQRGGGSFMVRIKLPAGGLTPEQMNRVADLSEKYGNGIPHVTDRQDVQLHWVKIEHTPIAMKQLSEVGLSTKGGGGNTVRNVTACADAGVCALEAFDVAPYAVAMTEYFFTHAKAYTLPRKFKIAFSGCSDDCALATINDVGFIAKTVGHNGSEKRGFRVYAGGGMGLHSRVAELLEDFIPESEALYVAEAVMLLFNKYGNRKNKHKARLRFVMERFGIEKFKELYQEELDNLKREGGRELNLRELPKLRAIQEPGNESSVKIEDNGFQDWKRTSVIPQAHEGYYYAKIRLTIGDIPAQQMRSLAEIVENMGEGTIRTTHDQNMMMRWLREEDLYPFYKAIDKIGLVDGVAGGVEDVLCCPGASSCNLGICLSRHMATELSKDLQESTLPLEELKDAGIKISGCTNCCGQHPIGAIGLQGAARRKDKGKLAPHYDITVGGRVEEGKTVLGRSCGSVPAKRVPDLIKKFLEDYVDSRINDEDFYAFLERKGEDDMKSLIKDFSSLPAYEEDKSFYFDWGAEEEFSLAGLGPGECGAGVLNMIVGDIDDAKRLLYKAEKGIEAGETEDPSEELCKALVLASKALLVTRGAEAKGDFDAFKLFKEKFVDEGLVDEKYKNLQKKGAQFLSGLLDENGLKEGVEYVRELIDGVFELYEGMDDSLKFKVDAKSSVEEKEKVKEAPKGNGANVVMDLKGVKCPINYVKAKIRIEQMEKGQTMELYLDDGEPINNVPTSLRNDGQDVLEIEKVGDHFKVLVKKNS